MSLFPLVITFGVLFGGMGLFVWARERQRARRVHRLREAKGSMAALPTSGTDPEVFEVLLDARELRLVLQAALEHGEQVELLDEQLTQPAREIRRRPLWLRLEDANYAYNLEYARDATVAWLAHLDGLEDRVRGEVARRGLELDTLHALAETQLAEVQRSEAQLAEATQRAAEALERFERAFEGAGTSSYR